MDDVDVFGTAENDGEPLVPTDCFGGDEAVVFDERGMARLGGLTEGARAAPAETVVSERWRIPEELRIKPPVELPFPRPRACPLPTLNGSWYLRLTGGMPILQELRGALRIEAGQSVLRASADMYRGRVRLRLPDRFPVRAPTLRAPAEEMIKLPPSALVIRRNWYPRFPQREYAWYLRSTGASYAKGVLQVAFERHVWSHAQQEFTSTDSGLLELTCSVRPLRLATLPQPTIRMTGQMTLAGKTYPVEAVKTSPHYRGCLVEVDVMKNRSWPETASHGGGTVTFTGVYRSQGLDFRAVVSDTDVPEDANLTIAELHDLMDAHRDLSAGAHGWHLWLLVGSRLQNTGTYGIMFDQIEPHREGAVGFTDPTMPNVSYVEESARDKALGDVAPAFLRTLIHEAGHAFNLYHPKHDVHSPPVGRTIMNQTGDVMGFASSSDPYPGNAEFAFNEHNATSLVHSPDPQVAPGWKEFGWGHGGVWGGVAEPVDVAGLADEATADEGLQLELRLPARTVRGEIPVADIVLTNVGDSPRLVTAALNLAEGDLQVLVQDPHDDSHALHDIVLACGPRRLKELEPGQSLHGTVQLLYTNEGFVFDQPGLYRVRAELDVGDGSGELLRTGACTLEVDLPVDDDERALSDLTMDTEVGIAIALGDVSVHERAEQRLTEVMDGFIDRDTGAIAALVLANSLSRPARDLATGDVVRDANGNRARGALDRVLRERSASDVVRLALAAASPVEPEAPVLESVIQRLRKAPRGTYKKAEVDEAEHLLDAMRA